MTLPDADSVHLLPRYTKVLLVMDVVESVRLMEQDEDGFVRRWRQIVAHAKQHLLPRHGGRIVKSLGDGLMLEFPDAVSCVRAALALQAHNREPADASAGASSHLALRIGAHLAEFVSDEHDIYGTDVNLTARIATLAGPDEIVVTAALRDRLTDGLDADIEDLGDCHLKHVKQPVRAYRIGPVGKAPVVAAPTAAQADFRPTIAVIPFEARSNEPEHFVIGELIADGVIAQLSRSSDVRVISRLSTTVLRARMGTLDTVGTHLDATYALSGSYVASGGKLLVMAELADTRRNQIIWAERLNAEVGDLLQAQSELVARLAGAASRALIDREVEHALSQPMPRLDSSALLMGGISMMHRSSVHEFNRSRQALEALIERHGRIAAPRAWLAKWHVMRIVRGMSDNPQHEARLALELTKRALDTEPDNALTLSVEGLAYTQVLGDFDLAHRQLARAIGANPNESMAWLFKSVLSTMWGSASDSVNEALFASALSPLDPLRYFFELITASALLADNQHLQAIEHAQRSIRANRHHAPTYRTLLTAQVELGMIDAAQESLRCLLQEQPGLTIASYLGIGSTNSQTRRRCADALRALGLPER